MDDLTPAHLRDGTEAFVVPLLPADREALRELARAVVVAYPDTASGVTGEGRARALVSSG